MAVTVANVLAGTDDNASGTATAFTTASYAFQNNRLYLLAVGTRHSATGSISSVTGGGLTWVKVAEVPSGNQAFSFSVWRGLVTSGATTGTLTINDAGTPNVVRWSCDEFQGVDLTGTDGSGAAVQSPTTSGTATSGSITAATFGDAANNVAWAGWQHNTQETTAAEASYTKTADIFTAAAPAMSLMTEYILGQDLAITASWATSSAYRGIAVEVKMAAAAVATPTQVVGTGLVPAPTAQGDATATPATTAGIGSVPEPTASGAAFASPTVTVGVGAVPAPTATGTADGTVIFLARPLNLTAIPISSSQIDLDWDPVAGAATYSVMRDSIVIATGIVPSAYSDTGLGAGTTHTYRVKGYV